MPKDDNSSSFFGYRWYKILTSSMSPEIKAGDIVFVSMDKDDLHSGDVITFNTTTDDSATLTHRIYEIEYINGVKTYTTKGDANEDVDLIKITDENIIGKVVFTVPKLGKIIDWITAHKLLICIIAGAIIIAYVLLRKFCKCKKQKRKEKEITDGIE